MWQKYVIEPSINANQMARQINRDKKNKASQDTQNRKYVIDKSIALLQQGKSIEEVMNEIMEDDIIQEFQYLAKNGLDIRNTIRQWVEANSKKIIKKENEIET